MKKEPVIYFYTSQQKIESDTLHPSISLLSSISDVIYRVHQLGSLIAIDTETEGMWNGKKRIIMIQLSNGKDCVVIDTRGIEKELYPRLKEYLELNTLILHNAKFDYKFFKLEGILFNDVHDTFLAENVLKCGYENIGLGLYDVCLRYTGEKLDKTVRNQFVDLKGIPFTSKQIIYGARDVLHLHKIHFAQAELLRQYDLTETYNLERKAVLALGDIEYNGMSIDEEAWKEVAKQTNSDVKVLGEVLDNHVLKDPRLKKFINTTPQLDLFSSKVKEVDINWASSAQVLPVLQALGLPVDNTNEKNINKYAKQEPFIKDLIRYKKSLKLSTAFGENFLQYVNPITHRVHQDIWQILSTGRMSSREPNLTQIPSKGDLASKIRACFIPSKDHVIVGGDFSGCELRIIADGSKDPVWLEEFRGKGKVHDLVACMMFGIDISQTSERPEFLNGASYRDVAKTIDFGLAYGMSYMKLADTIQISENEAKRLIDIFFSSFPNIKGFLDTIGNFAKAKGYVRTYRPFRRIRWFPDWEYAVNNNDRKVLGEIERAGKNMPIQGTNADITKLALVRIREYILANNLPIKIVNVIHDEILTECPVEYAEQWRDKMSELMTEAGNFVIKSVPMTVDCKISNCWKK